MSPIDPYIEGKLKRSGLEFLSVDIEAARTFLQIATSAHNDPEEQHRNRANARRAYDAVQKLCPKLHLSLEEQTEINEKLRMLKTELEALGENF